MHFLHKKCNFPGKSQNCRFLAIRCISLGNVGIPRKSQFLTKSCDYTDGNGVFDFDVKNLTQVSRGYKKYRY